MHIPQLYFLYRCNIALHHYYLQLRENLLDQWSGPNSVSEERCWEMAALALHADRGDNDDASCIDFRAEQYFPLWVINIWGLDYVRRNMPSVQVDLRGMHRIEATIRFCREASKQPFALNCHLYGLRRHKMNANDTALIGITTRGLEMADLIGDGERMPIKSLLWNKIAKLSFDKRKVTIVGTDNYRIVLYAQTDDKARYLLEFCKSVHQQIMSLQVDINDARDLEMKGMDDQ